ncbi:zinc finger protein Helios [Octopus bimaculoides]|nr:zinc finger protein Helios [Octopus bimaculoides]
MKMDPLYTADMTVMPFTCEDCNTVFMNRDAYAMHVMIRAKEKSCRSESRVAVTGSNSGNGRADIESNIGNTNDIKSSTLALHSTTTKETLSFVDQGDMSISEIENCIKEVKQEVLSNDGSNTGSPVPLTPKLVVVKTEPETNNRDCSLMDPMSNNGVISRRSTTDHQNVSCTDTSIVKEQSPSLMNSSTNLISSHHVICLMCDSQFADQDSLAMHMMSYHAESASSSRSQHAYHESANDCSHASSIQHFDFPSHALYQSTRRSTARLRCDECGAAFENEDFLTLHLISHRRGVQALHNTAIFNDPSRIYSQMLESKRKRQLQHGSDTGETPCPLPIKKNSLHIEPRLSDSYHTVSFDKHSKSSSLKNYLSKYNTVYKSHVFHNESPSSEKLNMIQKQVGTSSNNSLQEKPKCWKEDQLRYISSFGAKGVNRSQSVPNDFNSENSITSRPHSVGFIEKSDYQSKPTFLKNFHYYDSLYDRNVLAKNKEAHKKHGKLFDHQDNIYRGRNIGEGNSSKDRAYLFYDSWSKEKRTDKANCSTAMSSKAAIHNSVPVNELESQQGKQEQFVSSSNGSESSFSSSYSDILHELKNKAEQVAMCKHCDVIFLNRILYHLHMGLHNVNNPWQCNICGKVCNDVHNFTTHAIHF